MKGRIIAMASTCEQVEELLPAYEDGELSEDERRRLERHLASCSRCQEILEGLRLAWRSLGDWPDLEPSPSYRIAFWKRLGREEERQRAWFGLRWPRQWAPAAVAAALAVGFFSGVLWGTPQSHVGPLVAGRVSLPVRDVAMVAMAAPVESVPEPPVVGSPQGPLSREILEDALYRATPGR